MNLYNKIKDFLKGKLGPENLKLVKLLMPVNLAIEINRAGLSQAPAIIKAHVEYLFPLKSSDIVNNTEIRVIGLGRSGVHPIINWIGNQCKGSRVLFINNGKVKENPYVSGGIVGRFATGMFKQLYVNKHFEMIGKFRKKDCLIYSYESALVEEVADPLFEKNREKWVGKSAKQYDVLIMRDAFNYFASRVHFHLFEEKKFNREKEMDIPLRGRLPGWIKVWKNHAKEFLGITNVLDDKKVAISYNDWCKSKEYRNMLAKKLNLDFSDKGMDRVMNIGGGSTFDKLNYDKNASEMKTDKRWRLLKDDEAYRNIFKDAELIDLSNRIFGEIPGTDILLQ